MGRDGARERRQHRLGAVWRDVQRLCSPVHLPTGLFPEVPCIWPCQQAQVEMWMVDTLPGTLDIGSISQLMGSVTWAKEGFGFGVKYSYSLKR